MRKYKILSANHPDELSKEVEKHINMEEPDILWSTEGNLVVALSPDRTCTLYSQVVTSMTKD